MQTDIIHNKSCERMDEVDNSSIAIVVTSPPYFNIKDYAGWGHYSRYLGFVKFVAQECFRVVSPGGWVFWNVQDSLPFPPTKGQPERYSEPLAADSINIFREAGFNYEKGIIWYKGPGTATQRLFGSFPRPGLLLISGLTEHILFFRKPRGKYKRDILASIVEQSLVTKEEWSKWALDIWEIQPASASRLNHPAPFPLEIPYRLIRMFSYVDDVILDPFFGSGSTGLAAKTCGRRYIGYEIHKKYIRPAKDRIDSEICT